MPNYSSYNIEGSVMFGSTVTSFVKMLQIVRLLCLAQPLLA